jgi:hypothetical protein
MKNLCLSLFALGATLTMSAQISSYPYTETFDVNSQCTGWTVTNGTWFHNTTTGTIEVDNHTQTNVHAYLYSPWLNTNSLSHPIIQFDLRITDDDSTSCVPELDLGYDDSVNTQFNAIQMNIASNHICTSNLTPFYQVRNGQWVTLAFPLPYYNHLKLEFNSVLPGTGMFEVRNVYVGERNTTGVIDVSQTIQAAPNPAQNFIYVTLPKSQDGKLILMDMTGKVVSTFQIYDKEVQTINIETLPVGVYMLLYQDSTMSISKMLVKEKM